MEGWGMRGTGGMSEQRNFGRQTVGQRSAGQWIGGGAVVSIWFYTTFNQSPYRSSF